VLSQLVEELGLHRQKCRQHVAALVEGCLELKRFDAGFPSSSPHSKFRLFAWARAYSLYQQCRFVLWWIWAHILYYCFPLQNWSASDILPYGNVGIDDVLIPQCGINVFIDRCDLAKCPYTYFLRYAALYLGKTFFCIKEGNHELIRRLHQELHSDCTFHFNSPVSKVTGEEGNFMVQLQSGGELGPFHQVVMACQPHLVAQMLPSHTDYNSHRECVSHFETVVARSAVHSDPTHFQRADDPQFELGVLYDRTLGDKQHHYLHINPAQFYNIADLPKHTFVTVSYDDADPKDVIASEHIATSFKTTLSRVKADSQQQVSELVGKLHKDAHGIHMASAAFLGLMWHEDGLTMAQLAYQACVINLQSQSKNLQVEVAKESNVQFAADASLCLEKPWGAQEDSPETTIDSIDSRSESDRESDDTLSSFHEIV